MKITFEAKVENENDNAEAARLMSKVQDIAKPGTVVVAGPTHLVAAPSMRRVLQGAATWAMMADVVTDLRGDIVKSRVSVAPVPDSAMRYATIEALEDFIRRMRSDGLNTRSDLRNLSDRIDRLEQLAATIQSALRTAQKGELV